MPQRRCRYQTSLHLMRLAEMRLLMPSVFSGHAAKLLLRYLFLAARNSRQEEDLLLDIRGELQQVHNLRDSCSRDVAEAGEVGLVGNHALADEAVKADGQRHDAGDAGHAAGFDRRRRRIARVQVFAAFAAKSKLGLGGNGKSAHAASPVKSWLPNSLMPPGRNVIEMVPASPS